MHIYFSGIGGTGLGPLALIAKQAGFRVSGSDKQDSQYIHYLREKGITDIHIGQTYDEIAAVHAQQPIDWLVYTTAVTSEQADPPELKFCHHHNIRVSQRDDLLNHILREKQLRLVAVAGTHGKSTTTAMTIWLFKQLAMPVSYSVGAKIPFGDMGSYDPSSTFFVYEADEYARNFLSFKPHLAMITGIDWDHPDIYPTQQSYDDAFREFMQQTEQIVLWNSDYDHLQLEPIDTMTLLDDDDEMINMFNIIGHVNRRNAWQVVQAVHRLTGVAINTLVTYMNSFPGLSRRFEQLLPNLYTDYAHTPPKIAGAIQTAQEVAGDNVVVVYEGLHNTRQHFIKDDLRELFDSVKQLYIVPSYLAREDPSLEILQPQDIHNLLSTTSQSHSQPMQLNNTLKTTIQQHLDQGDLVLCLTAGGGGSLDEWLRRKFVAHTTHA